MKNKLLKTGIFLGAIVLFSSCSNMFQEKKADKQKVTVSLSAFLDSEASNHRSSNSTLTPSNIANNFSDVKKITLSAKVLINESSSLYEDFVFESAEDTSSVLTWTTTEEDSAYSKMISSSVDFYVDTYNLTLTLYTQREENGETVLRTTQIGTKNIKITTETEAIEIQTKYVDYGDLYYTIQWPQDFSSEIAKVEMGLYTSESNGTKPYTKTDSEGERTDYSYKECTVTQKELGDSVYNSAAFTVLDIPNGNYVLKYKLYAFDKETVLNTFSSAVQVNGYKTEKVIGFSADDLNSLTKAVGELSVGTLVFDIDYDTDSDGQDDVLYLNKGSLQITACAQDNTYADLSNIEVKLFYGANEVDSDFYVIKNSDSPFTVTWDNDHKLISGGTYTLYVSAYVQRHESSGITIPEIAGDIYFEFEVEDKEYYQIDISTWTGDAVGNQNEAVTFETLFEPLNQITADSIVVFIGNPTVFNMDTDGDNENDAVYGLFYALNDLFLVFDSSCSLDLDFSGLGNAIKKIGSYKTSSGEDSIDDYFPQRDTKFSFIKSVKLSQYIDYIAGNAFESLCNLESIYISEENQTYSSTEDGKFVIQESDSSLVCVASSVNEVDFTSTPLSSVQAVGSKAFANCSKLNSLNLTGVVYIGDNAFCMPSENWNIPILTIPQSVISIGNNAFKDADENILQYDGETINFNVLDNGTWYGINGDDDENENAVSTAVKVWITQKPSFAESEEGSGTYKATYTVNGEEITINSNWKYPRSFTGEQESVSYDIAQAFQAGDSLAYYRYVEQ